MTRSSPSLAKITRPNISGISPRERLFRLLDEGRSKPITWIRGPGGSGKTTLVASYLDVRNLPCLWYQLDEGDGDLATFFYYMGLAAKKAAPRHKRSLPLLTPEYLHGVPTFTRRYFENLFNRLLPSRSSLLKEEGGGMVLVLDSYQDVPGTAFQEMIAHALDVIPDGMRVIVVSRVDTPLQLARLRANNKISLVGWDELRFTREESNELLEMSGQGKPSEAVLEDLYKKTEGWAAGLVLMMESAERRVPYAPTDHEQIFNYFAGEIFEKSDRTIQDVLLKTSFLNKIEPAVAEKLTGVATAGQILEKLSQDRYFTQKHVRAYQYHPLFREFLLNLARKTFTKADLSAIQRNAALLLTESGQIEEAASLFRDAGEWEGLITLILGQARSLVAQGRSRTLEEWIVSIPKERYEDLPWMVYWLGVCCLSSDPAESRRLIGRAFQLFERERDETGILLAWSAAVNSIFNEWNDFGKLDTLLQWLGDHVRRHPAFPSPEIEALIATNMATAMILNRKSYTEFKKWIYQSLALSRQIKDDNLSVQAISNAALFNILTGDYATARSMVDDITTACSGPTVSPLMTVLGKAMETFVRITTMIAPDPLKTVREGLRVARDNDIHMWDHMLYALGVSGALNMGAIEIAEEMLKQMKECISGLKNGFGMFHYHSLSSWYFLLNNDLSASLDNATLSLRYLEASGAVDMDGIFSVHHELAHIHHGMGDQQKAFTHLEQAGEIARRFESAIQLYMYHMAKAHFYYHADDRKNGRKALQAGMSLGSSRGYISMFWWWQPSVMSRLCATALDLDIETEYARHLIQKRGLVPPLDPIGAYGNTLLQKWPYPLKIFTRDQFEIMIDNKPLLFTGKVQKKPLELLRALIDLGGRDVAEGQLTDLLWPEAEGDMAHQAFATALKRLRALLGDKEAIVLKGGRVTINRKTCWVDVLFEQ